MRELWLILSSIGVLHGLFFAVYLLSRGREDRLSNKLLAGLLLALTLRIGKSVLLYFFRNLNDFYINIGLTGFLAIGPFLLLYVQSLLQPDFQFRRRQLWHFLPAAVLALVSWRLPYAPAAEWWDWLYAGILLQLGAYLGASLRQWRRAAAEDRISPFRRRWSLWVTAGIGAVWLVYVLTFFFHLPIYYIGAVSYTFIIYLMALIGMHNRRLFEQTSGKIEKYQSSTLSEEDKERITRQLLRLMEEDEPWKDPQLTLPKLAEQLDQPAWAISQVVNERLDLRFPEFVNRYRVEEAKRLLAAPAQADTKISHIAYESGFNTLSAFNTAFKKQVGVTPSQFRKEKG